MADQFKNFMIGIFVLAASGVIIFILMFLHPRIGDEGKLLHIRFTDVDKITVGTRVTYAGKPVGEVVGIDEIEEGREGPIDRNGKVFLYDLTVRVDSGVKVFNTDEVASRTSGLLGEKNIEITPIAAKKGEQLVQIDDLPLYAEDTGSVEETFKEFKEVADKIEATLEIVMDILYRVRDEKVIEKLASTISNVESITAALNKPQELSDIVTNFNHLSLFANEVLAHIDDAALAVKGAANHFATAAISTGALMNSTMLLTEKANNGEGTLGKLLGDNELYLRVNSIMSKLETTMDDVNHYGLFFSSDKGWQRLRARRLNLLQQLRTPQEFRNYFNDEINQISTSLTRVYMVLNEAGCNPCCTDMLDNCEYNKVFGELMRRVKMLEEEVLMYNTQIVETRVHKTELGAPPGCPECCETNP